MRNGENCSLEELDTSAMATASRRSNARMMAIKALLLGLSHDQVAKLYSVTRRSLSEWVSKFNERGLYGLIEGHRSGRPPKVPSEQSAICVDLIRNPAKAGEIHWTGKKFHGYLRDKLGLELGYSTTQRWLRKRGFRLKVPRSWPDRQDPEKRQRFLECICLFLDDPEVDLWYLDESGVEGDPRPRRRYALARRLDNHTKAHTYEGA